MKRIIIGITTFALLIVLGFTLMKFKSLEHKDYSQNEWIEYHFEWFYDGRRVMHAVGKTYEKSLIDIINNQNDLGPFHILLNKDGTIKSINGIEPIKNYRWGFQHNWAEPQFDVDDINLKDYDWITFGLYEIEK